MNWTDEVIWEDAGKSSINGKGVDGEITVELIINEARNLGLKTFKVLDQDGKELIKSDFPMKGHVRLQPYNKAA